MTPPQVRIHLTVEEKRKIEIAAALEGAPDNRTFAHQAIMQRVEEILTTHKVRIPTIGEKK